MSYLEDCFLLQRALADTSSTLSSRSSSFSWTVLFASRDRALLVPEGSLSSLIGVVRFVYRKPWQRLGAVLQLWFSRLLPFPFFPQIRLNSSSLATLVHHIHGSPIDSLDVATCRPIIQFGSKGPLQKAMMISHGRDNLAVFTKIALQPDADARILHECTWLRRLSFMPDLAEYVPVVVANGQLHSGREYLAMQAALAATQMATFSRRHALFLERIAAISRTKVLWPQSQIRKRLEGFVQCIFEQGWMSDEPCFFRSWEQIDHELQSEYVEQNIVHGDFTPWNIISSDTSLIVLDWEYAQEHGNPLSDYCHFHLMQAALVAPRRLQRRQINELIRQAGLHLGRISSETDSLYLKKRASQYFMLYLLDTIGFYVTSSRHYDFTHPVLRHYIKLLETQSFFSTS